MELSLCVLAYGFILIWFFFNGLWNFCANFVVCLFWLDFGTKISFSILAFWAKRPEYQGLNHCNFMYKFVYLVFFFFFFFLTSDSLWFLWQETYCLATMWVGFLKKSFGFLIYMGDWVLFLKEGFLAFWNVFDICGCDCGVNYKFVQVMWACLLLTKYLTNCLYELWDWISWLVLWWLLYEVMSCNPSCLCVLTHVALKFLIKSQRFWHGVKIIGFFFLWL